MNLEFENKERGQAKSRKGTGYFFGEKVACPQMLPVPSSKFKIQDLTPKKNVCLITLGCPKNIVEGENLAGILKVKKWNLTTDINSADCAVVHTCSFIKDAKEESHDAVKALSELKKSGRLARIVVSGCLVQDEGKRLAEMYPEVDGFLGTGRLKELPELLRGKDGFVTGPPGGLLESRFPRLLSSNLPSAYLRIAEGCSHRCSYCVIPRLRGRYKSRKIASILREAEELAAVGIREIILIAQDTTYYGQDLYGCLALPGLLKKLAKVNGIRWIRVLYTYPSFVTSELLDTISSERKVCKYLDLPLQHASDKILRRMSRPTDVRRLLYRIKSTVSGISLRTTFIVGFPGETDKDFNELYDLVSHGWFDQLGVFEYSDSISIRSSTFEHIVPERIAKQRKKELMLLQKRVVSKKNKALVGKTFETLVESDIKKDIQSGRTSLQSPEVDSKIYFSGRARIGSFIKVKVNSYHGYDLIGERV